MALRAARRLAGAAARGARGASSGADGAKVPPQLYREDEADKSVYQKNEEGPKPRQVRGEPYPDWRRPWHMRDGEWYSKFRLFIADKTPSPDVLGLMQKVPDVNPQVIGEWWREMKEYHEIENQLYISERVEMLGSNLAAAHFFLFRNASIRFRGSSTWLKGDPTKGEVEIPDRFKEGFYVEAIDASTFHFGGLRYEGLANLANLNFLKWLSLKNNRLFDVWGADRVAGLTGTSLEFLDISGCDVKPGSIIAIAKMMALKVLVLTDPGDDMELDVALAALEEEKPGLIIKTVPPSVEAQPS